jgi:hypothetical protein
LKTDEIGPASAMTALEKKAQIFSWLGTTGIAAKPNSGTGWKRSYDFSIC